jgi:hypothetical protein
MPTKEQLSFFKDRYNSFKNFDVNGLLNRDFIIDSFKREFQENLLQGKI